MSLATVALFAGALVLAELAARLADPDYLREISGGLEDLHVFSEAYGWELRRGFRLHRGGKAITINPSGYRGREAGPKTERRRVVMLGDSVAFGPEVGDDETFSALIDANSPRFEVVNLAVPGYGTDQELIRLEREGLACGPDVVVLNFCLENDLADNALPFFFYDGVWAKPFFRLEEGELRLHDAHLRRSPLLKAAFFLRQESHLYNRLFPLPRARATAEGWKERAEQALERRDEVLKLTARLIASMRDRAAARGASFVVLLHPNRLAFQGRSELAELLAGSARREGVRVVDLSERYRTRSLAFRDFTVDAMGHLSLAGHRLAAEEIESLLAEATAPPVAVVGAVRPLASP